MDLGIAVTTYNRPHSLSRLLKSLNKAVGIRDVSLYISIDGGANPEVYEISKSFVWQNGSKKIITHNKNQGLKDHIIKSCDLSLNHDALLVLEDDLYISPFFYKYIINTVDYYGDEEKIAGFSLYSHCYNETAELPFYPLNDGNSIFFMQIASSWGQVFTKNQWVKFKAWYESNKRLSNYQLQLLPYNVAKWPESSWKKYFICYMIENNLFFAYPYNSYCTNFADKGINLNNEDHFQVALHYGEGNVKFCNFDESKAKYDSYCEILPECLNILTNNAINYPFIVDLYGNKPLENIMTDFIVTSRRSKVPIKSYAKKMIPHETNIIEEINGDDIVLSLLSNIEKPKLGYSSSSIVYYHKLPAWHKKQKKTNAANKASLTENEEQILRIFNNKIGKFTMLPILFAYRLYVLFRALLK